MKAKLIKSIFTDYVSTWSSLQNNDEKPKNKFYKDWQITVTDCSDNSTIFQISGKMSITIDDKNNQIEVMIKDDELYTQHLIRLSVKNTEFLGKDDVSKHQFDKPPYLIRFNPGIGRRDSDVVEKAIAVALDIEL